MIKKRLFSLKYRIAITVFILEAIMLTVVLWNTFSFIEKQAKDDLHQRQQVIIELIEQITSNSLMAEEYDDLQQYIEQISLDPEIITISILNKKNIIIAHSDFQNVGLKSKQHENSRYKFWLSKKILDLGTVEVEFSLLRIEQQLNEAKKMGVGIAATGMLLILFSGLAFGFLLTHKLVNLTKVIGEFTDSGEYVHIDVTGNDEIATLGRAFNHMSNKINVYIQRIETDNSKLEMRVKKRTQELEKAQHNLLDMNEKLTALVVTDHLTKIYNRIKIDECLKSDYARWKRNKSVFSLMLLDIDNFKSVNDTYGHDVGDKVLVLMASLLSKIIRKIDTVGRWGGEEFMIICPETDIQGVTNLAEKLRESIASQDISDVGHITCSFGVVEIEKNESIIDMIKRSDIALYKAKDQGRNCVVSG